jgi:hypothetical protein
MIVASSLGIGTSSVVSFWDVNNKEVKKYHLYQRNISLKYGGGFSISSAFSWHGSAVGDNNEEKRPSFMCSCADRS